MREWGKKLSFNWFFSSFFESGKSKQFHSTPAIILIYLPNNFMSFWFSRRINRFRMSFMLFISFILFVFLSSPFDCSISFVLLKSLHDFSFCSIPNSYFPISDIHLNWLYIFAFCFFYCWSWNLLISICIYTANVSIFTPVIKCVCMCLSYWCFKTSFQMLQIQQMLMVMELNTNKKHFSKDEALQNIMKGFRKATLFPKNKPYSFYSTRFTSKEWKKKFFSNLLLEPISHRWINLILEYPLNRIRISKVWNWKLFKYEVFIFGIRMPVFFLYLRYHFKINFFGCETLIEA